MRRRSNTLHANSLEEFTELATQNELIPNPFMGCQPVSLMANNFTGYVKRFQSEDLVNETVEYLDDPSRLVTKKVMIFGSNGIGKHTLVHSSFCQTKNKVLPSLKQSMDLIIKDDEEEDIKLKYYFWIRTLDESRFDDVVKVYYRNISVFIFMYSVTDRRSFETLTRSLKGIMSEISRQKYVAILIGNKCDMEDQREVSYSEGLALKNEYNLSFFLETNQHDKLLKTKIHNSFYKSL